MCKYAEEIIGDYQCGFRPNRSTTDQIHTMRQIYEKCYEYDIDTYNLFIDFRQAFDKMNREKIYTNLLTLGIPNKLVKMIKMTLNSTIARVAIYGEVTESFEINTGVRQGDALSTLLFNLTLEAAIRKLQLRGCLNTKSVQICAYADDIVICARSRNALIETLNKLEREAGAVGLHINDQKTKYMVCARTGIRDHASELRVGSHTFEKVDNFIYLGSEISSEGNINSEIQRRIHAGGRLYNAYKPLLQSKLLKATSKLRLYRTIIRPVVTYAGETWCMTEKTKETLRSFERKILRKIFGPTRREKATAHGE